MDHLEDIIIRIRDTISQSRASESDQIALMRNIRQLLELKGLKKRFPVLMFYCNWVMHVEIGREEPGWLMIEKATEVIINNQSNLHGAMAQAIATEALRQELIDLFSEFELPTQMFTVQQNWLAFVRGLIALVLRCPVTLTEADASERKAARPIYDRVTKKAESCPDLAIEQLSFEVIDDAAFGGRAVCWVATTRNGLRIVANLHISLFQHDAQ